MPKGKLTYRRGDIRWVKLDPAVGAEAQKTRACLIIQMDTINQHGLLTIVIPVSVLNLSRSRVEIFETLTL